LGSRPPTSSAAGHLFSAGTIHWHGTCTGRRLLMGGSVVCGIMAPAKLFATFMRALGVDCGSARMLLDLGVRQRTGLDRNHSADESRRPGRHEWISRAD
jgi:hypothetical protein